ncbi:MAG TPA: hypothetical protein VG320_22405 [Paraburkholderia sp.]|jgi:hypothetical protein|uniref:hypothetical protein n=1 Tax=Paraburkholderia sp. TaxID=1926495 RepID=UPI002DF6CFF6|nr:hypothetical protein [Paraburkholderia sp.]
MLTQLSDFLSRRSAFVLVFVLLEAGMLAGFLKGVGQLHAPAAGLAATRGVGSASACSTLALTFRRTATERDITLLLTQYGATIVYGPDENSAYLVRLSDAQPLAETAAALRESAVIDDVRLQTACRTH